MEPPAKRMRILQSVEVDDTNPDYINAKQKQQQKFKGRLESIFAKYENMHSSMSDEIDMRENKVVVDRGHLRRLVRQVRRKETVLLDNLGLAAEEIPEVDLEEDEAAEDSEDELAPTQQPKSSSTRCEKEQQLGTSTVGDTHSSPPTNVRPTGQILNPLATTMGQPGTQSIPITPNPAANLLSMVQFPQTPAGQQAQSSFYATLAQTINQAVQQAVAPLFSNIFSNTSIVQQPLLNPLTKATTPMINSDKVAPATDPKWFFPPLSDEPIASSSPLPVYHTPSLQNGVIKETGGLDQTEERQPQQAENANTDLQQSTISVAALVTPAERAEIKSAKANRRTSPRVEIQRKRMSRAIKYHFSEEDDIYISKQKILHNRTWAEIRGSNEKWTGWPMSKFHLHWSKNLKGKNFHLKDPPLAQTTPNESQISEADIVVSTPHHLPTPSSLSHDGDPTLDEDATANIVEKTLSSSLHFDEDERDLLSLPSVDLAEEHLSAGLEEDETFFPNSNEIILPSIELTAFIDEDMLQQGLLEDSPMEDAPNVAETVAIVQIKQEPTLSSPISKRKRKHGSIRYQAMPDSDTEVEDVSYDGITAELDIPEDPQYHETSRQSSHNSPRAQSASIDLVGHDELQAPISSTAHIKREFSTPPPISLLFSTPAAQMRPDAVPSSSSFGSASGLSRKAYLKQIKQSWTKKSTPATKEVSKRRSFQTVPRKRAWVDDGESGDELAM